MNDEPPASYSRHSRMMPNDYPAGATVAEPRAVSDERKTRIPLIVKLLGGCLVVSMIACLVLAAVAGVTSAILFSGPTASNSSAQQFQVSGTPLIQLNSNISDVTILAGSAATTIQLAVHKHVQAFNGSSAQSELNAMHVTTAQSGNVIDIETEGNGVSEFLQHRWIDLTITVPANSDLDLTTSAGDVSVSGVSGAMDITSSAGDLTLNNSVLEGNSTIHSSAGDIKLNSVAGEAHTSIVTNAGDVDFKGSLGSSADLQVQTDAGDITLRLPASTSAHLDATANAGDINIDTWPIPVTNQAPRATANGILGSSSTTSTTISLTSDAGDITVSPN